VRIDRQLRGLELLLSKYAFNCGTYLPFAEHDGLRIENAPAISRM
jgi:hypothetical protein